MFDVVFWVKNICLYFVVYIVWQVTSPDDVQHNLCVCCLYLNVVECVCCRTCWDLYIMPTVSLLLSLSARNITHWSHRRLEFGLVYVGCVCSTLSLYVVHLSWYITDNRFSALHLWAIFLFPSMFNNMSY